MTRHQAGVDAQFAVGWRFRLRFARAAFNPASEVLREVIEAEPGQGPARLLVLVDDGVLSATPQLPEQIRGYADAHREHIQLTGDPVAIPGGERAKNDRTVFDLVTQAIHDARLCRRSYVLVIGGGAVLDVVGFAAAVAHRGVRLIRMPTTTLAQDDSGVGVKNGINAFGKKNFLGSFAPPWAVINDSDFLATLSDRDWRSGLSECVKVALVKDATLFESIEQALALLKTRDLEATEPIIRRSAEWHVAHIVEGGDPFELTAARPLDFGHWAAHKLEQLTRFDLRHGEAVSVGVALDTTYSTLQGWLAQKEGQRVIACLRELGLPTFDAALERTDELLEGLEEFREHLGGRLTITMLRRIGQAFDVHAIDPRVVRQAIDQLGSESSR